MEWFTEMGNAVVLPTHAHIGPRKATWSGYTSCGRCGGLGGAEAWKHTGWSCYKCGGIGKEPAKFAAYTQKGLDMLRQCRDRTAAKRLVKANAKIAKADANYEAFTLAYPDVVSGLKVIGSDDPFVAQLVVAIRSKGYISEKQAKAVIESAARLLAKQEAAALSAHIGTIGERATLTLTTEFCSPFETQFGVSWVICMRDSSGSRVMYFGSSNALPDVGETATVTASIHSHDERKGEKQTIIKRPKAVK